MTDTEKVTDPTETVLTETEAPVKAEAKTEKPAAASKAPQARAKKAARKTPESTRYAVIVTGGKQYRVKVGDRIAVERLPDESGADIKIDQVLLIGGEGDTKIGTPIVVGASVSATIDEHHRGDKIVVFKFKAKKRYRRRTGHRQDLTRLTITGISG